MPKLPKFTLQHTQAGHGWDLVKKVGADTEIAKHFGTRADATKRGGLEKFLGKSGGEVRTEENGHFRGNHTYQSEDQNPKNEESK